MTGRLYVILTYLAGKSCGKILHENLAGNFLWENLAGKSCGKILWEISCGKILQEILALKSCGKFLRDILAGKSCGKFLVGNSCGKLLWEIVVGNCCGKILWEISCGKILWEILAGNFLCCMLIGYLWITPYVNLCKLSLSIKGKNIFENYQLCFWNWWGKFIKVFIEWTLILIILVGFTPSVIKICESNLCK